MSEGKNNLIIGLVISMVIFTLIDVTLITWKFTRRSANEIVKIENSKFERNKKEYELKNSENRRKEDLCISQGGVPDYWNNSGDYKMCILPQPK